MNYMIRTKEWFYEKLINNGFQKDDMKRLVKHLDIYMLKTLEIGEDNFIFDFFFNEKIYVFYAKMFFKDTGFFIDLSCKGILIPTDI